jgi:SIR2-like domain/TIR domain
VPGARVHDVETSDLRDAGGGAPVDGPAVPPLKVFLNYRREDTQDIAWSIYMKLEPRFGAENVFFDHDSLRPGMQWFDEIKSHLADSGAVLVLIGPQWASSLITRLQRGGDDYVVKEIDLALRSGPRVTVIPVLANQAELPDSRDLPPCLRSLLHRQAERLRPTNLSEDIDHLIERLEEIRDSGVRESADQPPPPAPRPSHRPSSAVAPPPDDEHYQMVAGTVGNLVVFLGSGANTDDDDGPWSAGSGRLPDDRELATFLAACLGLEGTPRHLTEVAQTAGALRGEMQLFEWVKQALRIDSGPDPVHWYLAHLPARLGGRYQMIVTPKYDTALEKAFLQAGEDFDLVVYKAPGTEQEGKFVHVPWDAYPRFIDKPNEYMGLPITDGDLRLRRTVIVRIGGTVDDPSAGFPWEDNYVITEDHYIDFLSGGAAGEVVPVQILTKLRRANYLFLGYTIADWRLRVFLQRIWKDSKGGRAKYWAIEHEPDALEEELWRNANVKLHQSTLTDYLRGLYTYLDHHPGEARP